MRESNDWNPGDVIVFRGVNQKKIWYALPMFVVQDKPSLLALYWPAGTEGKWRMQSSGARVTPRDVIFTPMELRDRTWDKTDVLMLITPGVAHAIYLMRDEGQKNLLCWYVNLQNPICRTPIGFDTTDHALDIVFSPDKLSWHWKDEDQLKEAVSVGLFTSAEALAIRKEGERVINLISENQPPFCDGWEKWIPPKYWSIPKLRFEWDLGYR
jgi:hypothetical protein